MMNISKERISIVIIGMSAYYGYTYFGFLESDERSEKIELVPSKHSDIILIQMVLPPESATLWLDYAQPHILTKKVGLNEWIHIGTLNDYSQILFNCPVKLQSYGNSIMNLVHNRFGYEVVEKDNDTICGSNFNYIK